MTKAELKSQLQTLGIKSGMKILVHVSLSKIGHLENGPEDFINALKDTVTENGIIVMPAYNSSGDYKPNLSIVNDTFKKMPDVIKTNQIIASMAVWGNDKEKIASSVPYTEEVTTPDGKKVLYHDVAYQEDDFNDIGQAFEDKYKDDKNVIIYGKIGNADCRLINPKILVDFAINWMNLNRK